MKKAGVLIFGLFILFGCGNMKKKESQSNPQEVVGSDRDEHGCINSAGYTWSEIKQECIRIWVAGKELNAIDSNSSSSAYVVFNEEHAKLELFLPGAKSTFILYKSEDGNYSSANYYYNTIKSTLNVDGVAKYSAAK